MDMDVVVVVVVVVYVMAIPISIRENRWATVFATIHVPIHHPVRIPRQLSCLGTQRATAGWTLAEEAEEEGETLLRVWNYRSSSPPPLIPTQLTQ